MTAQGLQGGARGRGGAVQGRLGRWQYGVRVTAKANRNKIIIRRQQMVRILGVGVVGGGRDGLGFADKFDPCAHTGMVKINPNTFALQCPFCDRVRHVKRQIFTLFTKRKRRRHILYRLPTSHIRARTPPALSRSVADENESFRREFRCRERRTS